MQRTRHDPEQAALRAATRLPGHVVDVVVLTSDGGLLATMRAASPPEHALWPAPTADAAVELLVGGRCGILIADLGTLRGEASALLSRLHTQFPELILLATGKREEEHAVADLVTSGCIYRFLHKPISPARASVFLSAATRRYYEMRNAQPAALATVKTIAAKPSSRRIAVGILVVVALLAALFIWLNKEQTISVPSVAAPLAQGPSIEQQIADNLARAKIALATGRLAEPRGDSAYDYYRAVLSLRPDEERGQEGLRLVTLALETRLAEAIQKRDLSTARATFASLRRIRPDYPGLSEYETQVAALVRAPRRQPSLPAPEAPPAIQPTDASSLAAVPSQPATMGEALSQAQTSTAVTDATTESVEASAESSEAEALETLAMAIRMREQDMLIAPAGSNAFEYMQSLLAQHGHVDGVRTEQQRLAFTLLERTRTSLAARDLEQAGLFLDHAEQLLPGMMRTRTLRQQLDAAIAERRAAEAVLQAAELKRTREIPPEYPRTARLSGTQGWVDVEFTIAADGTTRDLVITAAEPSNIFDRAAIEALRHWRFEPIEHDGVPVARRAIIRLRFQLED